ncbi:MAG: 1-acyl-sn-glycerol-3-phosphate acyltransferase [Clostridia bacterium]|nr:1-acyl-sn-glycerol-3-phosphate acyltransferase [Clostridia bacterium]
MPPFDPKTTKYPYTDYTDQHYLVVKKNNGLVFDKNYPYIDRSKGFRFRQWLMKMGLLLLGYPLMRLRLGLQVKGRNVLREHADELQNGAVSCANHVHMWDYMACMYALRPTRPYLLAWAPNVRGENGTIIRLNGGIPIPDDNMRGLATCMKAIGSMLDDGGWLHIYAEGSMWEYYAPIRPFKSGVGYFACRYEKPVLPMAFSFRRPNWVRRTIFRQIACLTLTIGEPLHIDSALSGPEQQEDITRRAHEAVCRLAGWEEGENPYPPIFHNNKRISDG